MPNTRKRSIRVPDWLWEDAQAKAEKLGVPVSHIIRAFLAEWTRDERT